MLIAGNNTQPGGISDVLVVRFNAIGSNGIPGVTANSAIRIFPNPSKGVFQLECAGVQGPARLLDMQGQVILQMELEHGTTEIDLSHVGPGTYVLQRNGIQERLVIY